MSQTKTIPLQVDEQLYRAIINRAQEKGFTDYQDYIKELCSQDIGLDLEVLEKFNRIMAILSEKKPY